MVRKVLMKVSSFDRRALRDVAAVTLLGVSAIFAFRWLVTQGNIDLSGFFGIVSPPVAAAVATVVGVAALLLIRETGGIAPPPPLPPGRLLLKSMVWLAVFCLIATATDLLFHFPADMNFAAPWSLVVYPAMGLIAEVFFHLAPLALILALAKWFSPSGSHNSRVIAAIAAVALIEPSFQMFAASRDGLSPLRETITFANLYAFSLVQLDLFRRKGFAAMYGFRLAYYMWWHIVWGAIRLDVP